MVMSKLEKKKQTSGQILSISIIGFVLRMPQKLFNNLPVTIRTKIVTSTKCFIIFILFFLSFFLSFLTSMPSNCFIIITINHDADDDNDGDGDDDDYDDDDDKVPHHSINLE